jgi:hypothetical protein
VKLDAIMTEAKFYCFETSKDSVNASVRWSRLFADLETSPVRGIRNMTAKLLHLESSKASCYFYTPRL